MSETSFSLNLRRAQPEDAPSLVTFNREMARETEGRDLDPDTLAAGVAALIENPGRGFYLVAEAGGAGGGGEIAGALMVTYEWSDWRNGVFWWIQSVFVRPEFRRRGVYSSLYREVKNLARRSEPPVCGFRLYVERDNDAAQQTYRNLGMDPTPYLIFEAGPEEG